MAYADQKMSSSRVIAIIIVALLHAVLGYAFVTGLAFNVVKKVAADMDVFDVEEPPPPEEEPPPPPPKQDVPPPPVVTPPPIVKMNTPPPPQIQQVNRPPPPSPVVVDKPAPPPPPPPKPGIAKKAVLRSGSISDDDYPSAAQRAGDAGSTSVSYTIGADGRVASCEVRKSSGSSSLDDQTCKLIRSRFRFKPAEDATGNKLTETRSQTVTWRLPKD